MCRHHRLSQQSSERCAGLFRALRARWDMTLAQSATAMGLCPASDDATLARMEQAIGTWSYERFDAFANFAARLLPTHEPALRSHLLGDGTVEAVDEVLAWEYVRFGSDACSRLLCRLECRWVETRSWTVVFRHLPAFLLPEQAQELYHAPCALHRSSISELAEVFAAMHERYLHRLPERRPRLTLVPLPGALSQLARRQGNYSRWDAEALADTLEFLNYDCIKASGTTVARAPALMQFPLAETNWILLSDDMLIRHRSESNVLDHVALPARTGPAARTAQRLGRIFGQCSGMRDDSPLVSSLFEALLAELKATGPQAALASRRPH